MVDDLQEQIEEKIAEEVNCNELPLNLSFRYFKRWAIFSKVAVPKKAIISVGWKQEKFFSYPQLTLITYTIAICSPKDHFSRKKAREIIINRFEKKDLASFIIGGNDFSGRAIPELIRIHYSSINSRDLNPFGIRIPTWAMYI